MILQEMLLNVGRLLKRVVATIFTGRYAYRYKLIIDSVIVKTAYRLLFHSQCSEGLIATGNFGSV